MNGYQALHCFCFDLLLVPLAFVQQGELQHCIASDFNPSGEPVDCALRCATSPQGGAVPLSSNKKPKEQRVSEVAVMFGGSSSGHIYK